MIKSEEWLKAEQMAKKTTKQWVAIGKPRTNDDKCFAAKKEARLNLRKAIKNSDKEKTVRENNLKMEANYKDPKVFSKLVSRNKNNNQGHTNMIKVNEKDYRGDAQVLSGFFTYHDGNSNPPNLSKSDDNTSYFYATINVHAIAYLIQHRNWKLPKLSFNQIEDIIDKLKCNKSPDYFGFSARNVKSGGFLSTHFLMN